jgi:hypothetical protein
MHARGCLQHPLLQLPCHLHELCSPLSTSAGMCPRQRWAPGARQPIDSFFSSTAGRWTSLNLRRSSTRRTVLCPAQPELRLDPWPSSTSRCHQRGTPFEADLL